MIQNTVTQYVIYSGFPDMKIHSNLVWSNSHTFLIL